MHSVAEKISGVIQEAIEKGELDPQIESAPMVANTLVITEIMGMDGENKIMVFTTSQYQTVNLGLHHMGGLLMHTSLDIH